MPERKKVKSVNELGNPSGPVRSEVTIDAGTPLTKRKKEISKDPSDRPNDTGANMRNEASKRGGVAPGVKDRMQKDYTDWYHSTAYTGRDDITLDTSEKQWSKGLKNLL